jgi:prophage antirepressor-like protein
MSAILPYDFESETIRVVMLEDDPWWIASDIASILGYRNAPDMTRSLDDDEQGTHVVRRLEGNRSVERPLTIISESGLFAAILKSRKPEARRFRRWVTGEVLPSLRRTGAYRVDDVDPPALPSPALDDAELPRITAAIGVMREARQVWGREECRRIWIRLGLPAPITEAEVAGNALVTKVEAATRAADRFQTHELALRLGLRHDRRTAAELGAALRLLGWERIRARVERQLCYVWQRACVVEAA